VRLRDSRWSIALDEVGSPDGAAAGLDAWVDRRLLASSRSGCCRLLAYSAIAQGTAQSIAAAYRIDGVLRSGNILMDGICIRPTRCHIG